MDDLLRYAIPLVCIVGVAVLVIAVILVARRQRQARRANLLRMGFSPVEAGNPALAARIERLYRHRSSQRIRIDEPFQRAIEGGQLVLFDLVDTADSENSNLASNVLGVASPRLNLPQFAMLPWAGSEGPNVGGGLAMLAAGAAQNVLGWAMKQAGMTRLNLPYSTDFNRDFSVYAKDQPAAFDFFTPERVAALQAIGRRYEIQAGGDFFTMKMGLDDQKHTFNFNTQPDVMLADAARLLAVFEKPGG